VPNRGCRVVMLVLLAALIAACAGAPSSSASPSATATSHSPAPTAPATEGVVPPFAHVYTIVLENASFATMVGNSKAPYLNGLMAKYGLSASYFGVSHPSQPNYLALFSGSTQGITDDSQHDLANTNLADQLEAHGKTWRVVEQDYPGGCFTGSSKNGQGEGIGSPGTYVRKHNPAISFADIRTNPVRCANITNLVAFDPSAANYQLIVPNECNDMHSCPIATADAFLATFVPRITSNAAFTDSVLFITTDEGEGTAGGGGRVATVVLSPLAKPGFTSSVQHDHYALLRTI
jgi:hypothetical protein